MVTFVARFVRDHFLKPNVVETTKMGLDNMVLIFGPCYFGDSSDAFTHVMNLNTEQDFVKRLFKEVSARACVCVCCILFLVFVC